MRAFLWNSDAEVSVSFPWYDSLSEIEGLFGKLEGVDSGLVTNDVDQGWAMEIHAEQGALFIRERDPDSDETYVNVRVPRHELVRELNRLRHQAKSIVSYLTQALGADVWTTYVRVEPSFGFTVSSELPPAPVAPPKRAWWRFGKGL
ncbi:hypothetical protein N788_05795 [Arenimonas donghaensis DSM 18148 = HO3-R19]|uniref:Uncharacterized protein n=2 Tax=Arenimonas TaxID=490567 RepID=A0A087MGQ4_9GAMM|nr:hypothetical protein N788_05795 [Arenimonas donghaensis DSM 18148 = HO3-R19]